MKRSPARPAVASWLVTAGVLGAGAGLLGAVPAVAEPGVGAGPHDGTTRTNSGLQQSLGGPPAGNFRQARPTKPRLGFPIDAGSDSPALASAPARRVAGAPQLGLPVERVPSGLMTPTAAASAPISVVAPAPAAPSFPAPARTAEPWPLAAQVKAGPAPVPAPAAQTPARHRPGAEGGIPEAPRTTRVGLPSNVTAVSLPNLVALALPGLLALAGLTAVGGFVGLRQARAGVAVNSAGARLL